MVPFSNTESTKLKRTIPRRLSSRPRERPGRCRQLIREWLIPDLCPPAQFGDFYWNSVSFCDESNSCIISVGNCNDLYWNSH